MNVSKYLPPALLLCEKNKSFKLLLNSFDYLQPITF